MSRGEGGGRPKKEINWIDFEKLCALHCTLEEVAGWFECHPETLQTKIREMYGESFSTVFKRLKSQGNVSLRRKMFETAMKGNVSMQIWLSKQHLDMKDKIENTHEMISFQEKVNRLKELPKEELIKLVLEHKDIEKDSA